MTGKIEFGTSGYRGIIGQTFTTAHVEAMAAAIAHTLEKNNTFSVIIGYDTRTGNSPSLADGSYTKALVDRLTESGITVYFSSTYTATPVISWAIEEHQLGGGIILTASHNPANYNGLKFNGADGAPASPAVSTNIAQLSNQFFDAIPETSYSKAEHIEVDYTDNFVTAMIENIDTQCQLNLKNLGDTPIVIDPRFGTAIHVWDTIQKHLQLTELYTLNNVPDSNFGSIDPNPTNPDTFAPLIAKIQDHNAVMGIAHDPDSDRHVVLDEQGQTVSPEDISVILLDGLMAQGVQVSGMASTVASSGIVRNACLKHTISYDETEVGFKYFTPILKKARQDKTIVMAVESSGGFSTSFHTMEKCGFLPVLLLLALVKQVGRPLSALVRDIHTKYGEFHFVEEQCKFPEQAKESISKQLSSLEPEQAVAAFSGTITELNLKDGAKILFEDGSWVLLRLSGTEPLARIYAESQSAHQHAEARVKEARQFLESCY